jgi:signal recognition particle receptor subunit alpha
MPESTWDIDFVIETGYWQDNEPLMRALSKLINMNEPDMVLFVGEALVGNDGVDQLTKFNQVTFCKLLNSVQSV